MAEQLPPDEQNDSLSLDPSDNPPEPTLPIPRNNSLSVSLRAQRGSPAPEAIDIDSLPPTPASSTSQLQDPSPPGYPVADPFQPAALPQPSLPQPTSPPPSVPSGPSEPVPASVPVPPAPQPGTSHPTDPQGVQVNSALFAQLIELGFEDWTARLALTRTLNRGVEEAVQWIVERSNESDFESGESGDETEDDEMGAAQSGESSGAAQVAADMVRQLARSARTHKMVFVANMSLKMGTGKLAAQVGHAVLGVYQHAQRSEEGRSGIESWQRMGAVKIVLKGESTEQLMDMFKAAKDAGCVSYLVQDAGYTQIPPGSRTILGVFGPVEAVDSVTGGLKLL